MLVTLEKIWKWIGVEKFLRHGNAFYIDLNFCEEKRERRA
jgi:hypothetical protein